MNVGGRVIGKVKILEIYNEILLGVVNNAMHATSA